MLKRRSLSMNIFMLAGIVLAASVFVLFGTVDFLRLHSEEIKISGYGLVKLSTGKLTSPGAMYLKDSGVLDTVVTAGRFFLVGLVLDGLYLAAYAVNLFGVLSKYVRYYFLVAAAAAACMITGSVLCLVAAQNMGQGTLGTIPGIAMLIAAVIVFIKESPFFYTQNPKNFLP